MRRRILIAVKAPVFSFVKLADVDAALTPEMKSTGEVLGIDTDYSKALLKAFQGAGFNFPLRKVKFLFSLSDVTKEEGLPYIQRLMEQGYSLVATKGTSQFIESKGIACEVIDQEDKMLLQDQMKKQRDCTCTKYSYKRKR